MTLEDVKQDMAEGSIRWGEVAARPALLREILTKAAEEISVDMNREDGINLPTIALEIDDLRKKFKFLDDKSLNGLYHRFTESYTEEGAILTILKTAEIESTIDDIVKIKKLGRNIQWQRFYGKPLNTFFHIIADSQEPKKPVSFLNTEDFLIPQACLEGDSFRSLYDHAVIVKKPDDISPIMYLQEKAGIKMTDEDIINGMKLNLFVPWKQIQGEVLRLFIQKVSQATEINKPIFLWNSQDFRKKLSILNGHTILGLQKHIDKHRGEQNAFDYLFETAEIKITTQAIFSAIKTHPDLWKALPQRRKNELFKAAEVIQSISEVIDALKEGGGFWDRVLPSIKKELIEKAAAHHNIKPIFLNHKHLRVRFPFLNNRGLDSLYRQKRAEEVKKYPKRRDHDIIGALIKENDVEVSIPDVLAALKAKLNPIWSSIPSQTIRELLKSAIAESDQRERSIALITQNDFKISLNCLEGKNLLSLYTSIALTRDKSLSVIGSILNEVGVRLKTDDIILAYQLGLDIPWRRVSNEVFVDLFSQAAKQLEKPVAFISYIDLYNTNFDFLGGKNLSSLYEHIKRKKTGDSQSAIAQFKERLGLPHSEKNSRREYRRQEMHKQMQVLLEEFTEEPLFGDFLDRSIESMTFLTDLSLGSWIHSVGKMYQQLYNDIEKDEIVSEIMTYIMPKMKNTPVITCGEMVEQLHELLETYCNKKISDRAKKRMLSTPIKDTNITLGKILPVQNATGDEPEKILFIPDEQQRVRDALASLTPLEREIVVGITVDQRTFEEIAKYLNSHKEEFGLKKELDGEMVQEICVDVIEILRERLSPSQSSDDPDAEE